MNYQYENYVTSSLLMYLDNRFSSQSGFYNVSSRAFPINTTFNGYLTYAFPLGQMISDYSINGTNQLSGIYINGSWITPGQSGWSGTNYQKSQLYFDPKYCPNPINSISGNYSIKEINVVLADFPDTNMLFENKLSLRPKVPQTLNTGLLNNILTYPAAFIENESAPTNKPWMFGGVNQTRSIFNVYLFCDSLYQKNACMGILKDMAQDYIPLIDNINTFPFNNLGDYKNGVPYNYEQLTQGYVASGKCTFCESSEIAEWAKRSMISEIEKMTQDSFFVLGTITTWSPRVSN